MLSLISIQRMSELMALLNASAVRFHAGDDDDNDDNDDNEKEEGDNDDDEGGGDDDDDGGDDGANTYIHTCIYLS
jgi:ABC-type Zn2+ transport system substrate-binding protein/surface adhesin